jgi:hypothetical protein
MVTTAFAPAELLQLAIANGGVSDAVARTSLERLARQMAREFLWNNSCANLHLRVLLALRLSALGLAAGLLRLEQILLIWTAFMALNRPLKRWLDPEGLEAYWQRVVHQAREAFTDRFSAPPATCGFAG